MPSARPFTLIIRPVAPFRLDFTVWALRRRGRNAIDRWDGATYRRIVVVAGRPTEIAVRQAGSAAEPRLIVMAVPPPRTPSAKARIRKVIDCLLGPRVDLSGWYRLAGRDPRLRVLAERFRGVKPPRFPTVFEALVNAFACQQLSLEVGLELLNRLAALCGVRRGTANEPQYAFPSPRDVALRPAAKYQAIGFSRQKVRALLTLARAIERRDVDLETLSREDDPAVYAQLLALRGVGRWSA
jgi:DNA-3-methyladenine glycosylase II